MANVAAIELSRRLQDEQRPATAGEQQRLARWSSWGAIPQVFDPNNSQWSAQHDQLKTLLADDAYKAASRTTINAHYTSPEVATAMWSALEGLGFDNGTVLEPGCGSGTFMGTAPDAARMVGVELDPTTAAITAGLYPQAQVRAEGFEKTRFPEASFDAAIGNVPFADVALHDRLHNSGRHSIHNHFIIKSLALTRPGGVVAVLTSRYTMDAQRPAARREMQAMADLVGAVRLPSGTHRRSAGTEAVTDLLIFRRRGPDEVAADFDWELTRPVEVGGTVQHINGYLVDRPGQVLGELSTEHGMFADQLVVRTPDLDQVPAQLQRVLDGVVADAQTKGLTFTPAAALGLSQTPVEEREPTSLHDGTIVDRGDSFVVSDRGFLASFAVPKTQEVEMRALLGLRDQAETLLKMEASTLDTTDEMEQLRAGLRGSYEQYQDKYGPLNRYATRSTGRYVDVIDELSGDPVIAPDTGLTEQVEGVARITPPVLRLFQRDPRSALVRALEQFDESEQTAAPASLLLERMVVPRQQRQGADTPSEAISMSLDQTGGVDLELIGDLLGVEQDQARTQLGELVFDDPATQELVFAPEYLSGDVRVKLDQAVAAAEGDERFGINVERLQAIIPDPIGIDEIEARMGSVWISPEIHQQFLSQILRDRSVQVANPLPGEWEVRGQRHSVLATSEWGTQRRPATEIAQACMEQRTIIVFDTVDGIDGKKDRIFNPVETTAAQEKAELLQDRFSAWVWEDPERATELAEVFNRRFNSIVLRDYTQAGDYLTLPGMARSLVLEPHQRAAVARMISEPAVGLFHGVGAGKTLEMVAGATEMKRMGLIRKPLVVVPNHMLEQFSREWLQAYPQANILVAASNDIAKDKRALFVARAATNDWDAIIMTQSAFKRISVSTDTESAYIGSQLDELRATLAQAQQAGSIGVKRIEKRIAKAEADLAAKLDTPRVEGVNWEEMGVDYLVVDEAHMYKNLGTVSSIQDAAIKGSQSATDMHMKLEWLRDQPGSKVGTMATATPLANSITEAYVMQRYLRPDLLEAAGVTSFDGWAATFGSTVTEMELGVTGDFRLKTRFARFQNVPEMLRMWHVFADVKTPDDLNLDVPLITERASDGKREAETIVLDPTPELEPYIAYLGERAEAVTQKKPLVENDMMLLISTDGRKAALDMRLIDEDAAPTGVTKLDAVSRQVLTQWKATRDNEYLDKATREVSPIRGGMQMVFCDLGTPKVEKWDAYTQLKQQLIDGGMDPASIRFIHEARNDVEKGRMFAAARSGNIAVLIGSTGKMGMGTNVQDRLTALHHVDCPWRPADLEQRDGRAIRRGNMNPEVAMYRYVVERSFDAYSWQTVARKAQFIAQVMKGKLDSRELEDIGDTALSAAEVKALASGNPLLLEKATATGELQKLKRQEVAHRRAQSALVHTQSTALSATQRNTTMVEQLTVASAATIPTAGDRFRFTIGQAATTTRTDAAAALGEWARENQHRWQRWGQPDPVEVGTIGGHTLTAHAESVVRPDFTRETMVVLQLRDVPLSASRFSLEEFTDPGTGTIRTLENKTTAIDTNLAKVHATLAEDHRTLDDVNARLGKPFPHIDALATATARVEDIDKRLAKSQAPAPESAHTATLVDVAGRPKSDNVPDPQPEPVTPSKRSAWAMSFAYPATQATAKKPTTGATKETPPPRGHGRDGGVER